MKLAKFALWATDGGGRRLGLQKRGKFLRACRNKQSVGDLDVVVEMKKAGAYAASLAAASSAALTALNNSDHGASSSPSSVKEGSGSSIDKDAAGSVVEDKFAPRFDGLRGKFLRACRNKQSVGDLDVVVEMKKAGAYAASLAAASSAALTALNNSDHGASSSPSSVKEGSGSSIDKDAAGSVVEDKFAPRFDGLRFIETLVTAHR
ncbi:hypothetical protein C4D60_Mb04t32940 [Musa balbisiana]|uniref:Uncharacterized protein n=1 Tax=Musa balbisiana TaxID=52838 RepID=A0A4S8KGK2_MUSBA|nr:hypothetical protein C4D60_Mb04t32940 [Musa balbisiana]